MGRLTNIGKNLKEGGLSSYTKEYTRLYMKAKRKNALLNRLRENRINRNQKEDFTKEDLEYIKSIAIK